MFAIHRASLQSTLQVLRCKLLVVSDRSPVIYRTIVLASSESVASQTELEDHPKPKPSLLVLMGTVFPFTSFNASVYSTPMLLLFRLFYNAAALNSSQLLPKNMKCNNIDHHGPITDAASTRPGTNTYCSNQTSLDSATSSVLNSRNQYSTAAFFALAASLGPCNIVSITWVKALSSPLSHEFVQCIVEDTQAQRRYRIAIDRHEDGDWVHTGLSWKADTDPHYRLGVPLPLVSLIFEPEDIRPSLSSFAMLVAGVSASSPEYNPMREMCWWFAEVVFEKSLIQFGGRVKEWEFASLRYSLVVRTNLIRRNKLTQHSNQFRSQNAAGFDY